MSVDDREVGEVSADGQLRWDGSAWAPVVRRQREPTSWTVPMRRVVAVYLVVSAVVSIVLTAVYLSVAMLERTIRTANPGLPDDQVNSQATVEYATMWALVVVLALLFVGLAAAGLIGWRWVFWVDAVVVALSLIDNALIVAIPVPRPQATVLTSAVLALASAALLLWLVAAAFRYGPWAMRRPGT
jgi:hypothetical protein